MDTVLWLVVAAVSVSMPPVLVFVGSTFVRQHLADAGLSGIALFTVQLAASWVILIVSILMFQSWSRPDMTGFDLDGDGVFSGAEQTPAWREASGQQGADAAGAILIVLGTPAVVVVLALLHGVRLSRARRLQARPAEDA